MLFQNPSFIIPALLAYISLSILSYLPKLTFSIQEASILGFGLRSWDFCSCFYASCDSLCSSQSSLEASIAFT